MNLHALIAIDQVGGAAALKTNDTAGALSDTLDLKRPPHGFHINTAGTIKVRSLRGNDVTLTVAAGQQYSYGIRRIFATGTTLAAADIVLLYGV